MATNGTETAILRTEFLEAVRARLTGPSSADEELAEKPNKRYLTGMVFPRGSSAGRAAEDEEDLADDESTDEEEELESPMDMLFQKLPASVGLTFAIHERETTIRVGVGAAKYRSVRSRPLASDGGNLRGNKASVANVWKRTPLVADDAEEFVDLPADSDGKISRTLFEGQASLFLYIRKAQGARIATVTVVNERECGENGEVRVEDVLFQVRLRCSPGLEVTAYPDPPIISEDQEAEELALQYRGLPTFAVGHGCSAAWPEPVAGSVSSVAVDFLPAVEVPPVTTDIDALPESVQEALSLRRLQDDGFDPFPAFSSLIDTYQGWQNLLAAEDVAERFAGPRERILGRIGSVITRMHDGLELLRSQPDAMRIFRLANRAMLLSIARAGAVSKRLPGEQFRDIDIQTIAPDSIRWRPFQLAFFLLSLRGLWDPTHEDRDTVDLIWFATGGGKTEAYLAVAAFEMLRRRFIDGDAGNGTAVIKRYTLRLLTIQQFERAGGLICSLETLRKAGEIPGGQAFSLGLWVGKESSPNEYSGQDGAISQLNKIRSTIGRVEGVKLPLKHCPVCGSSIVPNQKAEGAVGVGMRLIEGRIDLFCPNTDCSFNDSLPISFIDEHLYENPPTMLLGTIDKFAMLAWRDEARAFFGTDSGTNPPSLIIQDELHLISGPLGTLAGIYEAAIDAAISTLCRPAKYICATATIRRADEQIRRLYGRDAQLFPPPGLDSADSFFSRARTNVPGRLYVGAMGQGHTPTFSNVIASTALLASGGELRERAGNVVDTWWTLVAYHNSKRELGKTLSLARDDIPARLRALGEPRTIRGSGVLELSANLRDSEIPEALHHLSMAIPDASALDFVACTNMLSVGVDVQRLGLMMINGQPKTVSEYIQASSRVGRDSRRPPGIVFTLFSPTKPRDRSHYEFFGAFHRGYYRYVEPTSVTPFALPARDRGLHGAFLALVRMVSPLHSNNHASRVRGRPEVLDDLAGCLLERVAAARDGDIEDAQSRLKTFISYWKQQADERGSNLRFQSGGKQHASLIRQFRQPGEGWETLQSLRHVDTPLRLTVPEHATNTTQQQR